MANQYQLAVRQIVWVRLFAGVSASCFVGAYLSLANTRDLVLIGAAFALVALVFYGVYLALLKQAQVFGVGAPPDRPTLSGHLRRHGVAILTRAAAAGLALSATAFLRTITDAAPVTGTPVLAMRALLFGIPIGGLISVGFQLLAWEAHYNPDEERSPVSGR